MSKTRVLLVEDEIALGKITSTALGLNEFNVVWAKDGEEGWRIFQEHTFDICVLDIMMPKVDGYTLAKQIRTLDPTIPIIFLSARTLTEDIVKGFELGGNDYLRKPYSIEELTIRMRSLLKMNITDQPKTAIFKLGVVSYDYDAMKLIVDNTTHLLTFKENEIFNILINRKSTIVKRTDILMEIWGDDNYFNARSMDVFITKLRKYLAPDPNIKIVNLRGIGYKLIIEQMT